MLEADSLKNYERYIPFFCFLEYLLQSVCNFLVPCNMCTFFPKLNSPALPLCSLLLRIQQPSLWNNHPWLLCHCASRGQWPMVLQRFVRQKKRHLVSSNTPPGERADFLTKKGQLGISLEIPGSCWWDSLLSICRTLTGNPKNKFNMCAVTGLGLKLTVPSPKYATAFSS